MGTRTDETWVCGCGRSNRTEDATCAACRKARPASGGLAGRALLLLVVSFGLCGFLLRGCFSTRDPGPGDIDLGKAAQACGYRDCPMPAAGTYELIVDTGQHFQSGAQTVVLTAKRRIPLCPDHSKAAVAGKWPVHGATLAVATLYWAILSAVGALFVFAVTFIPLVLMRAKRGRKGASGSPGAR